MKILKSSSVLPASQNCRPTTPVAFAGKQTSEERFLWLHTAYAFDPDAFAIAAVAFAKRMDAPLEEIGVEVARELCVEIRRLKQELATLDPAALKKMQQDLAEANRAHAAANQVSEAAQTMLADTERVLSGREGELAALRYELAAANRRIVRLSSIEE